MAVLMLRETMPQLRGLFDGGRGWRKYSMQSHRPENQQRDRASDRQHRTILYIMQLRIGGSVNSVSYTHLTLPTIYSV